MDHKKLKETRPKALTFSRDNQRLLVIPLAMVIVPFLIWPAVSGLVYSFTNYAPGQVHLHWVGVTNYAALLEDATFRVSWRNILVFTLVAVPVELGLGFCLAYLLRPPFRGRGLVRMLLFIPWLVSPIANGVIWYFLLNLQVGIVNFIRSWLGASAMPTPLGLNLLALPTAIAVSVWRNAPFASFLLLPGLLAIPAADWDYATLEGASVFNRIRYVAWPWLRPLFFSVALLLTGDTLGAFDTLLLLTGGGPGLATMTPALYSYQQAFQVYDWPLGATSAWFIVFSMVLVGIIYLEIVRQEAQ